jgi:histidine ammonia-lyase
VDNAEHLLAIELLAAAEGLEFRRPLKAGAGVEQAYQRVRELSPAVEADRSMSSDIARVAAAIREGVFDDE